MTKIKSYAIIVLTGVLLGSFLYLQIDKPNKLEIAEAMYVDSVSEFKYVQSLYLEKQKEADELKFQTESKQKELDALKALMDSLQSKQGIEKVDFEEIETIISNVKIDDPSLSDFENEESATSTTQSPGNVKATMDLWQLTDDLPAKIDNFWEGSILEGKGKYLVEWCKLSSTPRPCIKVIAAQTLHETHFGNKGFGASQRNLTGIKCESNGSDSFAGIDYSYGCRKGFRVYDQYHYSLLDTVRLFIEGDYQSYFTLYGWEDGLSKYLRRFGTNQYSQVLNTINTKL